MIHYIFAAAFGALIGSQSKKSKKSYADGGLIVSWFDKDINYQSKRFDTKKMEDAKRFFYQKQSEYLKPTLTTYDNDVILDSTYAKGGIIWKKNIGDDGWSSTMENESAYDNEGGYISESGNWKIYRNGRSYERQDGYENFKRDGDWRVMGMNEYGRVEDFKGEFDTLIKAKKYVERWVEINPKDYAKGGKMFVPQGREILYQDENVALQHNKVSDHYSMINPETGRYMAKGGEVKEWEKYVSENSSWFDYETRDSNNNEILLSTRENGSVGDEEAGQEDIDEAKNIVRKVIAKFPKTQYEIYEVDEWVNVTLMPNKTKEQLGKEKIERKQKKIKKETSKIIAKELNVTNEKALEIVEYHIFSYAKEYYEENKDSKPTYNNAFRVYFKFGSNGVSNIKFDSAKQVFDYISKDSFAEDVYYSSNPRQTVHISLYGLDSLIIDFDKDTFGFKPNGDKDWGGSRREVLSVSPFFEGNIENGKDFIQKLRKAISDFIITYKIYVLQDIEDFAKGGEVSSVVNNLQKGDLLKIKFGSIASRDNEVSLKVRSRNKIRNGRIDKITFENVNNPDGARFYAYERGNGVFSFAMGDLAISNIEIVSDYAKGGMTEHGLQLGDKIIGAGKNSINVVTKKGGQKKVDLSEGTRESFAKGGKTLPRPAKDFIAYVIDMDGNATLKYSKTFQGANRMMKNLMKKIQDVSTHGISKYDPFYGTRVGKMFFEPIKGFAKGGMTEHGLEIGDKIIKEKDNAVLVVTKDEKNTSIVNLDKGIRANFEKGGKTNWIQEVVDSPDFRKGAFTKKAKERGLTPEKFMRKVLKNPDKYDERTRKQAQFMKNITD